MDQNRVKIWYYWGLVLSLAVFVVVRLVVLVGNSESPTAEAERVRQFAKELGCTERNELVIGNRGGRLPDELIFDCNHLLVNNYYMRFLLVRRNDEQWKSLINELGRPQ